MTNKFEQISIKSGFMKHNSGLLFRKVSDNKICVTISLDIKFIGATKLGDEIIGYVNIQKVTNSLVFLICDLKCNGKIIASASGVWKKIKNKLV